MTRSTIIVSLALGITLFLAAALGIPMLFHLASETKDRILKRTWYLVATTYGGLLITQLLLILQRAHYSGTIQLGILDSLALETLLNIVLLLSTILSVLLLWQISRRDAIKRLSMFTKKVSKLEIAANTDALTGLLNRRALSQVISNPVWDTWVVIMLDIDDFKPYNDSFGHQAGDAALELVAECIQRCIRNTDYAFRYGGEEFLIVCPHASKEDGISGALRIQEQVANLESVREPVTVSIGLCHGKRDTSVSEAIAQADSMLYNSKRTGKNQISCN